MFILFVRFLTRFMYYNNVSEPKNSHTINSILVRLTEYDVYKYKRSCENNFYKIWRNTSAITIYRKMSELRLVVCSTFSRLLLKHNIIEKLNNIRNNVGQNHLQLLSIIFTDVIQNLSFKNIINKYAACKRTKGPL